MFVMDSSQFSLWILPKLPKIVWVDALMPSSSEIDNDNIHATEEIAILIELLHYLYLSLIRNDILNIK